MDARDNRFLAEFSPGGRERLMGRLIYEEHAAGDYLFREGDRAEGLCLVLEGQIDALVIVAAPRTLRELRNHYHKALSAILVGEVSKDLTGHAVADVEKTIAAA